MRMLLTVEMPVEPFNTLVREKKAGGLIRRILEDIKPEAAYFGEVNGCRHATLVINISEASQIPSFAEPFFQNFNANCKFRVVMTPEDLAKANLDAIADKWA